MQKLADPGSHIDETAGGPIAAKSCATFCATSRPALPLQATSRHTAPLLSNAL
jgi:hypothetical protein